MCAKALWSLHFLNGQSSPSTPSRASQNDAVESADNFGTEPRTSLVLVLGADCGCDSRTGFGTGGTGVGTGFSSSFQTR